MNLLSRLLVALAHRGARLTIAASMLALVMSISLPLSGCTTVDQPAMGETQQDDAAAVDAEDDALADQGAEDSNEGDAKVSDDASDDGAEVAGGADAADDSDDEASGEGSSGTLEILPSGPVVAQGEVVDLPDKPHPLIGQPAPDFTMTDVATGEEVSLSDFAGQPVLVNFWATWCPPCRLEMPWFEAAYQQHKDDGFVVLAVDAGEKGIPPDLINDTVMRYVTSSGLTFPVLLGDNAFDVQQDYSVTGLPSTFLVDRDGNVVQWHSSAYPNQATLDARLEAILGEG